METLAARTIYAGASAPLGATLLDNGVNFSLFSRHATAVDLLLFDDVGDRVPARTIPIPPTSRSYFYWHLFVPDLQPGQIYGYRVEGPQNPSAGLRFDPSKVLLDPYGRAVAVPRDYSREAARRPGDNTPLAMKSVVVDPATYDWEGDAPLHTPSARTIIYELHVRGFTRHPSSGLEDRLRGTYAGLIHKIPYLKRLGITAVELLPIFEFDPQDAPAGLVNYWGYQPISFFAPHHAFSSRRGPLEVLNEFRDMVKALHRAGIEVILDVVFNHTTEGSDTGPTLCFRGIDNPTYYLLQNDRSRYADFTGCGNTLNTNHPVVRRMIVDSLRHWVEYMHVDGFRFDLASILARDSSGHVLPNPPVLWDIETDPILAGTKLIAEAWDAAGLYQVGSFVGDSWKEWNGRFRDDVRSLWRGDHGALGRFADRFVGSPQVYGHEQREPEQSINFVTCHDGFTLNDLVSYNQKHNLANGEENRDGSNDNTSWNCGVEGPSDDPAIERLRVRHIKNLLATTLLALGVPMLYMGDEVCRTQNGNNNAYCQDNPANWFDWTLLQKHNEIHRFVTLLIERRLIRSIEHEHQRLSLSQLVDRAAKAWHGVKLDQPDWSPGSLAVALTTTVRDQELHVHFLFNASSSPLLFELPSEFNGHEIPWYRWIDTSLDPPHDIVNWLDAPVVAGLTYRADAHSLIVLFSCRDILELAPAAEDPPSKRTR